MGVPQKPPQHCRSLLQKQFLCLKIRSQAGNLKIERGPGECGQLHDFMSQEWGKVGDGFGDLTTGMKQSSAQALAAGVSKILHLKCDWLMSKFEVRREMVLDFADAFVAATGQC